MSFTYNSCNLKKFLSCLIANFLRESEDDYQKTHSEILFVLCNINFLQKSINNF